MTNDETGLFTLANDDYHSLVHIVEPEKYKSIDRAFCGNAAIGNIPRIDTNRLCPFCVMRAAQWLANPLPNKE